jgi:hypothetical protein
MVVTYGKRPADTAECPQMDRTVLHNEELPGPEVNSAGIEKPICLMENEAQRGQ